MESENEHGVCRLCGSETENHPHDQVVDSDNCANFGGSYNQLVKILSCEFCDDGWTERFLCDPDVCNDCAADCQTVIACPNCRVKIATLSDTKSGATKHLEVAISSATTTMQILCNEVVSRDLDLPLGFKFPSNENNIIRLRELSIVIEMLSNILGWN